MYAIIEDSGSQIMVREGDTIKVAKRDLAADAATVLFDKVVMLGTGGDAKVGQPYVDGAKVTADILGEERTDRVPVVKFKRRKGYLRMGTHRQDYLSVKITSIQPS